MLKDKIKISVLCADALKVDVDVLAVKYAQRNYGLDEFITTILVNSGVKYDLIRPKIDDFCLVDSVSGIMAKHILFLGTQPSYLFGYVEIRNFSCRVLNALAHSAPYVKKIALTLHGVGFGLDDDEAFKSEIAGLLDAINGFNYPEELEEIIIVERNQRRANQLASLLGQLISTGYISTAANKLRGWKSVNNDELRDVGYSSASKDHVFVAMPFKDDMDDVYHYGIQNAARQTGFLCERADLSSFTGDVMSWVRERIKTASIVIADLTEANPNVYLEVGYAWGCGVPTVLLVKDTNDLKFDTRGQRCLTYKKIKELEPLLINELKELKINGVA